MSQRRLPHGASRLDGSSQQGRPVHGDRAPVRVVSIAHTGVSRASGRLRYHPLRNRPDIDCHLVVPARWREFGRVITADGSDDAGANTRTDPGVTVHVEPIRWSAAGPAKWYLHTYPRMGALIRELKPDVIHLWEEPWSFVAAQAAYLRARYAPRASLVLEVDQNILKRLPPPFEMIRRHVLARTDLVLARSSDADNVVRATGFTGTSLKVGYGVDRSGFTPASQAEARADFGITGFTIGYVGRIVEEKGLDDAVEALALSPVPVNLAILGEGPHLERLMQRAAARNVSERILRFGWDTPARVSRFINALDALILLTRTTAHVREQFGRVIIEAQSCGVPVIGSTSGAIPDIVGEGGWIVPERSPEALANLLGKLGRDPHTMQSAAIAGLAQVNERFTFDKVAATLADAWTQSVRKAPHQTVTHRQ